MTRNSHPGIKDTVGESLRNKLEVYVWTWKKKEDEIKTAINNTLQLNPEIGNGKWPLQKCVGDWGKTTVVIFPLYSNLVKQISK